MTVGIVDYGMGNLLSVFHALEAIGAEPVVCSDPAALRDCERVVLPGVGAFRDCIQNLRNRGFIEVLNQEVLEEQKPILGICLGMQAMAQRSFEGGHFDGLGWFEADVIRLEPAEALRVPHVGWNVVHSADELLFRGVPRNAEFYFVHSYWMKCAADADVAASFQYGGSYTAAVRKDWIFATQFHPEKSQDHGLKLLHNFLTYKVAVHA